MQVVAMHNCRKHQIAIVQLIWPLVKMLYIAGLQDVACCLRYQQLFCLVGSYQTMAVGIFVYQSNQEAGAEAKRLIRAGMSVCMCGKLKGRGRPVWITQGK